MAIKSLLLVVVFFLSTLGLACSNDDKFGGGTAGHEAYLNWLAKQNLWVQTQNNNGKPVSIEDNKDFFKDPMPKPSGTANEREVAPPAKSNQNSFWE